MEICKANAVEQGCTETLIMKSSTEEENILETTTCTAEIPIWEKLTFTLTEAAKYSGIGVKKYGISAMIPHFPFVLRIENKRLIKRRQFDAYIGQAFSI